MMIIIQKTATAVLWLFEFAMWMWVTWIWGYGEITADTDVLWIELIRYSTVFVLMCVCTWATGLVVANEYEP